MGTITDLEFQHFRNFIFDAAGISLSPAKKELVSGRLAKRLQACSVSSYSKYFALLKSGNAPAEVQIAIDLLTTNETYFFREANHFDALRAQVLAHRTHGAPFRVWSAACSTGEEAYSIAMVLADCLESAPWEVVGSDISTRVLQAASKAHYSMERARHIPQAYLRRFCLKGIGDQAGSLLVERHLRDRVHFRQVNLNAPLPDLGMFDAIFLRNAMIYFSDQTKREVLSRVLPLLRQGGHFFVGHAEVLHDLTGEVTSLAPSIYRKT